MFNGVNKSNSKVSIQTSIFLQAYNCLEELAGRIPKKNLSFYVNMKTIEAIYRSQDIPMSKAIGSNQGSEMNGVSMSQEEEDGEEVEEDVVDDYQEDQSVC